MNIDKFIKQNNHVNYCEAILYKDGTIEEAIPSHTEKLLHDYMKLINKTRDEVYDEIQLDDSPLIWLLEKLHAISIWHETFMCSKNNTITQEQIKSLDKLFESKLITFNSSEVILFTKPLKKMLEDSKKSIEYIYVYKSKHGIPCLWEKGGSYSDSGSCELITNMFGKPKKALFIVKHGPSACTQHALIPVRVNDHIIEIDRIEENYYVYIKKILEINNECAKVEVINSQENKNWKEIEFPSNFKLAILRGRDKCNDYHCRTPYYILNSKE